MGIGLFYVTVCLFLGGGAKAKRLFIDLMVFLRGFWKKRVLDVVFWWCSGGAMRGKRGQETVT
jgi:hypothetical protein